MSTRIIKGQALIIGDSLVQDQIKLGEGPATSEMAILIEDIWADLSSAAGKYKRSTVNPKYFYWEYKMHNTDDEEITVQIECPKPKEGLFGEYPYESSGASGEYSEYWIDFLKKANDNYNKRIAIQVKEVEFPEKKYPKPSTTDPDGVIPAVKVTNENYSELINLLNQFGWSS